MLYYLIFGGYMKKMLNKKNIILLTSLLLFFIILAIIMHFNKYSESEWLKHFDDTSGLQKISNFSFWWYIGTYSVFGAVIYIYPIILVSIACINFFTVYRSGFFQNVVMRVGYKKTMTIEVIKSWIYALILPLVSSLSYIICRFCYSNSIITKYIDAEGYPFQLVNDFMENMNPYLFMIIYFLLITIFGIIIINIGLCLTRVVKKFYLVVLGAFITFIFIENINNLLIAPIVSNILGWKEMMNGFSLYNIYYLNSCPNFIWEILFSLFWLFISTLFVYILYSKRESVILEYE